MAGVAGTYNNPDPENMTLEQLLTMFQKELSEWENAGITPDGIRMNVVQMDFKITALINLLIETGVVDQETLDKKYVAYSIEQLKMHRGNIMELRKKQGQGMLVARKPILGADGAPLDPRTL